MDLARFWVGFNSLFQFLCQCGNWKNNKQNNNFFIWKFVSLIFIFPSSALSLSLSLDPICPRPAFLCAVTQGRGARATCGAHSFLGTNIVLSGDFWLIFAPLEHALLFLIAHSRMNRAPSSDTPISSLYCWSWIGVILCDVSSLVKKQITRQRGDEITYQRVDKAPLCSSTTLHLHLHKHTRTHKWNKLCTRMLLLNARMSPRRQKKNWSWQGLNFISSIDPSNAPFNIASFPILIGRYDPAIRFRLIRPIL